MVHTVQYTKHITWYCVLRHSFNAYIAICFEDLSHISQFIYLQNKSSNPYPFHIDAEMYKRLVRYRYDPFCVQSSIHIVAEVKEIGRSAVQSDKIIIPLVSNPISLEFHKSNPTVFRPGLPYTVKVCIVSSLNAVLIMYTTCV